MHRNRVVLVILLAALLAVALVGGASHAQESGNYRIGWYFVSRGGGQAASADYVLTGAAGPSLDDSQPPSSDNYIIVIGPGQATGPTLRWIFLPLIVKD